MSRTDKQHGESAPLLSSSQAPSRDYGVRGNEQLERSTNTISGSQDEGQQLATGIEEVPPKDRKKRPATPLPKMQLFVLCLMRMTERECSCIAKTAKVVPVQWSRGRPEIGKKTGAVKALCRAMERN